MNQPSRAISDILKRLMRKAVFYHVLIIILAGMVIFHWKVRIVAPIKSIGHADAAAYAEMADSLLQGRGIQVDYISWYFMKYDPAFTHTEDAWSPLYSVLIVPFFAVMEKTAFAAKLPSMLVSSFLLPLSVYVLARRVTRSGTVALVSALTIMIYYPVFAWSIQSYADITFTFLITLMLYCAVKGFDNSRWFYGMGLFLGLAYYAKGSTPVFVSGLTGYYILWRLLNRPYSGWTRRDSRFVAGIAVFLIVIAPWMIRNTVIYGKPFYSVQNHISGYIGWIDWDKDWDRITYDLYWGEKEPPSILDKLRQPGTLIKNTAILYKRNFWWLFLQRTVRYRDLRINNMSTALTGIPALIGIGLFTGHSIFGLVLKMNKRRRKSSVFLWRRFRPYIKPEYGLLIMTGFIHISFFSFFWYPEERYLFPVLPPVFIMGWAVWFYVIKIFLQRIKYAGVIASIAILILFTFWADREYKHLRHARKTRGFAWREGGMSWMNVGGWIRDNVPGSVTMTRNPWELHFYSDERTIQIPYAPLERVIEVAHYYGATHLIPDKRRPALDPWVKGEIPGLVKVFESRHLPLYEIDYGALPDELKPPGLE